MITIKNLNLIVGQKRILHNISFNFLPGTIYGLLGANGSGKTTLLNCISGLNKQYSGFINADSCYVKNISYLQTDLFFYDKMKGIEFIKLCLSAKDIGLKNFEELSNLFGIPVHEFIETYSTGMKKKLMFLIYLLIKDKLILLDEPFANIDIQTNNILIESIKKLADRGSIIIIASHDLDILLNCANHLILINNGTIINYSEENNQRENIIKNYKNILGNQRSNFMKAINL